MSSENLHLRRGRGQKGADVAEKVLVAVKASREIPRTALVWALTHVVQQGKKFWGFPRFSGDCASGHRKSNSGSSLEMKSDISDTCSQMMLQLHNVYDPNKINVKIKIASGTPIGAVAAESKRVQASWVVLDKQLKHEVRRCMEELQCNIVVMKRSQPKVLRLNLVGSPEAEPQPPCQLLCDLDGVSGKRSLDASGPLNSVRAPAATPTSSPEHGTSFTATEAATSSVSSSDLATSPFSNSDVKRGRMKNEQIDPKESRRSDASSSGSEDENLNPSKSFDLQPWVAELLSHRYTSSKQVNDISHRFGDKMQITCANAISAKFSKLDGEAGVTTMSHQPLMETTYNGNVREAISLSRSAPLGPPPLCSICQHKAPVFGKPPRLFNYAELELATGGFSQANFLAEGGFGSVHRGVLPDGQVIAVKQHKLASSQGDLEFCSEVEVLSCAQHRNVVMLIGFCVEDRKRLLVYEYICNGSLDSHLYGRNREPLQWPSRQKIAVGAARGLRYLHEECRVGCIVHRDMRPNNILLTHDFEPLVGDFGLARWQPDGDKGMKTRVIGTLGYLAPEYAQSGQITEKADVYSFGVVLLELVTGRKAVDINRPKGQQCLTEWARPLLEGYATDNLVDPRLGNQFSEQELYCMLHAASLCIRRDPHARPRMSQVLRALEGDIIMEPSYVQSPGYDVGSRSRRMRAEKTQQHHGSSTAYHREISEDVGGTLAYETLRAAYLRKTRPVSCDDED